MIWSHSPNRVKRIQEAASTEGLLRESSLIHARLIAAMSGDIDFDLEPVKLVDNVSPRSSRSSDLRLVEPYVTINASGALPHPGDGFYTVTMHGFRRPTIADMTQQTLVEAHAIAERTALTRGIFTKHGRSSAEKLVIGAIWKHFRPEYASERIDYLKFLIGDVVVSRELNDTQKEQASAALIHGLDELGTYL